MSHLGSTTLQISHLFCLTEQVAILGKKAYREKSPLFTIPTCLLLSFIHTAPNFWNMKNKQQEFNLKDNKMRGQRRHVEARIKSEFKFNIFRSFIYQFTNFAAKGWNCRKGRSCRKKRTEKDKIAEKDEIAIHVIFFFSTDFDLLRADFSY